MKTLTYILFLNLSCFSLVLAQGQSGISEQTLLTALDMMEQHAVDTDIVPWDSYKQLAKKKWKAQPDETTFTSLLMELFDYLGDFHGGIYFRDSLYRLPSPAPEVSAEVRHQWEVGSGIRSQMLNDSVGYLRVPGMPYIDQADCNRKAQQLNDSLCSLLQQSPKGLIIDLRLNGGGAMYPMILGLQQLIEKGNIGGFTSDSASFWTLEEKRFLMGTTVYAELQRTFTASAYQLPVAFLISPVTGSSAEFLLIAFQGRQNTVLVGTKTAGFMTATQGFPIGEETFLLLSTAYGIDRNGKIHKVAFSPDIFCDSVDEFTTLHQDAKVQKAMEWIHSVYKP